jgi:hypothetical protein
LNQIARFELVMRRSRSCRRQNETVANGKSNPR